MTRGFLLSFLSVSQKLAAMGPSTPFIIDGDNVRGKSGFALSKEALLQAVRRVATDFNHDCTILHFDHGAVHEVYHMPTAPLIVASGAEPGGSGDLEENRGTHGFCAVFSGPSQSSDDAICHDIQWWSGYLQPSSCSPYEKASVVVVTDDSGLQARCRQRASKHVDLSFISSRLLVEYFDEQGIGRNAAAHFPEMIAPKRTENSEPPVHPAVQAIKEEQFIRNELRKARQQIKHGCSKKKQTKLKKVLAKLEERARAVRAPFASLTLGAPGAQSLLDGVVAAGDAAAALEAGIGENGAPSPGELAAAGRATILEGLLRAGAQARGGGGRGEHTWERVVTAERLRASLGAAVGSAGGAPGWAGDYSAHVASRQ